MGKLQPGQILLPLGALVVLWPAVSAGEALLLGMALALLFTNPFLKHTRKMTRPLLSISIVGLGAGMDLLAVGRAGLSGIGFTVVGLSLTLLLGWLIGRALKTSRDTSLLINVGTAICGGSAIAAMSNAIGASEDDTSLSLAIVFLLNACALFLFPILGHSLNLSEGQFGLWSALAIHDTSSVVGATMQYGPRALQTGTTIKLVRALWIIPLTLIFAKFFVPKDRKGTKPPPFPWFILGFLAVSALVTFIPPLQVVSHQVEWAARRAMVLTLFLIGSGLSRATLQKVGVRPLVHGVLLWFVVACANLLVIEYSGWAG